MGLYKIDPKSSVEDDLRKIDRQYIARILDAIESLTEDPFSIQSRKMKGSESSYCLRIEIDYRALHFF